MFDFLKRKKNICVLTLRGRAPMMCFATLQGGKITVLDVEEFPSEYDALHKAVIPKIQKLVKRKTLCLIDERTGDISRASGGKPVSLEDMQDNGDPIFVTAIERYYELKRLGAVTLPPSNGALLDIPERLVNTKYTSTGKSYEVDWNRIKAEQILMMLIVYACTTNHVHSVGYLSDFQNAAAALSKQEATEINGVRTAVGITQDMEGAITHADRVAAEKAPKSLTGQRSEDGSWFIL